jgi:hypothetical protein
VKLGALGIRGVLAAGLLAASIFSPWAASAQTPAAMAARRGNVRHNAVRAPGAPPTDPPNGMVVTTPVSATAMATALLGSGVTLSGSPSFQGAAAQGGTFTSGPSLVGFSSGVILSSGNVTDAGSTYIGSDLPDTDELTAGYAPLGTLVGTTTHDAAVLTFSFIPTATPIFFTYTFASAEYPNFVGSQFNDPMALFINGTAPSNNIAFLPISGSPIVSINNVNATTNSSFFNHYNTAGDNLEYGGETIRLTATANVNVGVANTLTLAVADASDDFLDSAVFIQSGSLSTTPPPPPVTGTPLPPALMLTLLGLASLGVFYAVGFRKGHA